MLFSNLFIPLFRLAFFVTTFLSTQIMRTMRHRRSHTCTYALKVKSYVVKLYDTSRRIKLLPTSLHPEQCVKYYNIRHNHCERAGDCSDIHSITGMLHVNTWPVPPSRCEHEPPVCNRYCKLQLCSRVKKRTLLW